jgi:hypothetical protein
MGQKLLPKFARIDESRTAAAIEQPQVRRRPLGSACERVRQMFTVRSLFRINHNQNATGSL